MLRGFVVIVYAFVFILALISILPNLWLMEELFGAYGVLMVIFILVIAFCNVLISFFVYIDEEEINRLRKFTGLAKHEEKMLEEVSCGTCVFYKKPALCPRKETNPKAQPCKYYKKLEGEL